MVSGLSFKMHQFHQLMLSGVYFEKKRKIEHGTKFNIISHVALGMSQGRDIKWVYEFCMDLYM